VRKPSYVLDSYALLAYLQAEPGGERIRDLLREARTGKSHLFLSLINLGEISYIVARRSGDLVADVSVRDILRLPVQVADASMNRVMAAARVKAHYPVSYADAFAVALAQELKATVVTGDPEFKKAEALAPILWI
jgi:predicted nucleic acid-binding protein